MKNVSLVGGRVRSLFTNEFVPDNADYDLVCVGLTYKQLLQYLIDNNADILMPEAKYILPILNDEFEFDKFFDKDNSNWTTFKTGVVKVNLRGTKCTADYVLARKSEVYDNNNVVPSKVIIDKSVTLEEDTLRRDFSMNALSLRLEDPMNMDSWNIEWLYDICSGVRDINDKVIRCINGSFIAFYDDPSRILRLIKFMLRLGYDCSDGIKYCLQTREEELIYSFIHKMNTDRTSNELKHIFNKQYNAYDSMELFMRIIPPKLGRVILNNELYLNPTVIDPKLVKKQAKWR